MQPASSAFEAANDATVKQPVYLLHLDGKTTDYCTSTRIGSPTNTLAPYMKAPKGNSQSITPEEGKSSIGQVTVPLLDVSGDITALIGNDSTNLHRKKGTLKAGYADMDEADMLTVFTGWVTDIKMWPDGTGYDIVLTDPQKWLQRQIFRGSEDTPVTLTGNPINIALAVLTSTGNGTNGTYDWLAEENGVGIDQSLVDISHIEEMRDHWFAGEVFDFDIRKRITAKRFLEEEIWKPCNLYPIVRGDGRFDIVHVHPPYIGVRVQSFDEDNIIGMPSWDQNLSGMINEISFKVDYDAASDDYTNEYFYMDSDSISGRGPGKKALEIRSRGIKTANRGLSFIGRRSAQIFDRYATPPPAVKTQTFFSRQLSEVGDIVPVTHSKLPNLAAGSRGLSAELMEIIARSVNWKDGKCDITFLDTGWKGNQYASISPSMTVVSGSSGTVWAVSAADAAKYDWAGAEVAVHDEYMHLKATVTILTCDASGNITSDDIGETPQAGWIVTFAEYADCTSDQKKYGFISDSAGSPVETLIMP